MRKKPPTAAGMAIRRTVVSVFPTGAVVSPTFTVTVVLTLGTSELLTVALLVSGRVTAASAEYVISHLMVRAVILHNCIPCPSHNTQRV